MTYFLIVLLSPIIALLFLPLKKVNRDLFYVISILISVISIFLSFSLSTDLNFEIPSIDFSIIIDKYSKIFLLLVNSTWLISIIYSYEYTKYQFQEKRTTFFIFLNILLSVVMINACAGNLITLFVFYFIGIPLTYPLINLRNNDASKKSAIGFLEQTILPSFLIFLPAIIITETFIGHVSFNGKITLGSNNISPAIGGLLLCMFVVGISKNSVFPFHTWLPNTNTAPAPVSGLIHSAATVKTGSIALIKIAVYIFGLDYIHVLTSNFLTGGWLIYLCGLTAIYTAYRALTTDDLKRRFAFSTVGQLSYIILAILIGTRTGIMAAMLHIVTHAIAKSCLFYVAGFYNSVYKTTSVKHISEIMPNTRFIALVIAICGLSITGFPFLAGYYSKDLMLVEEWHSHYYSSAFFLLLGSIINLFYIIGPVKNAFKKKNHTLTTQKIPFSMLLTFIISIILIIGCNYYVSYLILVIQ
ncbi:MAG TPA: proton-conducting transporter membrane subunit [Bacteroidia bacterium]|nr:proton-conducting transporter membrane subunit [Bacteroidia bacterium]